MGVRGIELGDREVRKEGKFELVWLCLHLGHKKGGFFSC